jgi:hypothetical protein
MSTVIIPTFKGMTPRTFKRMLSAEEAQVAENCRLESGILEPLSGLGSAQASASAAQAIFRHGDLGWMSWAGGVDVVRSTIVDNGGHYLLTGDGYPKQGTTAMDGAMRRLGIPKPSLPLSVELTGAPEADASVERSSSYCFTYVCNMGTGGEQEGAPSDPTGVVDVLTGQGVSLTGFGAPVLAGLQVDAVRVYRSSGGEWFFLTELASGVSSFLDEVSDAILSTVTLATDGWTMPEDDARGLVLTKNGMYVLHRDNEVLPSELFVPYAYPADYRLSVQDQIVGLGVLDGGVVVLTTVRPVVLVGSTPESLAQTPLEFYQGCLSKASIVSTPYGVMYASPDGLCLVASGGPRVVTRGLFTTKQWRALQPNLIMGACFEDQYFAFFRGTARGIVYDFASNDIREIELSGPVYAVVVDAELDAMFLNVDGNVVSFEGSEGLLTYRWRSGEFFMSRLVLPAVARVESDFSTPVTFRIFAHDALVCSRSVTSRDPFRLEMHCKAENAWTIELEGTAKVFEVRISTSIEELENGI